MSLPNFETLKAMAERNEGELEALLQAEIDILLQETPPERRRKLLGLQFHINCQKELSHNPVDCCVRLSNMLRLYYEQMSWRLEDFYLNGTASLHHKIDGGGERPPLKRHIQSHTGNKIKKIKLLSRPDLK